MNYIETNLLSVQQRIANACQRSGRKASEVTLVAVSKGVGAEEIKAAYDLGIRDFGENRLQEAQTKIPQLDYLQPQIKWHMIGHVQSNKAKRCVNLFEMIHSVDSIKLAALLSQQEDKIIPILLQVNISEEESKSGFDVESAVSAYEEIGQMPNLSVKGLMTMAPYVEHAEEVRPVFSKLRQLRDRLGVEHLSMGMTDDFEVAIEEGATLVRIGRAIFGERSYKCV